jgi:hypothetical protein
MLRPAGLRPPRRSDLVAWGAAALTAAALYALPYALLASLGSGAAARRLALLAACLAVLAVAAARLWSPLLVLAAAVLSGIAAVVFWFVVAAADTCGNSVAATAVELPGAATIALALGAWGVRGGRRVFWALPLGWILAGLWIAVVAHAIPGGTGGCFE